jgi:hypothetical protein
MMLDWQSNLSRAELDALPVGCDDQPVYADTSDGGRYLIDYGPWVKGQQMFVLAHDGHRIGSRYYQSVRRAQRAAVEHMLSHGLRPRDENDHDDQSPTHVTGAPMPTHAGAGKHHRKEQS